MTIPAMTDYTDAMGDDFRAAFKAWSAERPHGDVNCQGAFRAGWLAAQSVKQRVKIPPYVMGMDTED